MSTQANFAPTGVAQLSAGLVSSSVVIPTAGTPTILRVANPGDATAYALGRSHGIS